MEGLHWLLKLTPPQVSLFTSLPHKALKEVFGALITSLVRSLSLKCGELVRVLETK